MRRTGTLTALVAAGLLVSCQREKREPNPVAAESTLLGPAARESQLIPGGAIPGAPVSNPLNGNAYAISEGQRLFSWYNCAGCHAANGGGGIGPALNDQNWIYGGEPANIFETIVKGRPNGMPSWGGRIAENEIWELVAYVRSLSGQQPKSASPARSDNIEPNPMRIQNKVQGSTR